MTSAEADNTLRANHDGLVGRLALLEDDGTLDGNQRTLAAAWRERLELGRARAEAELRVAFIAEVGKGKSTLIAAAAGLRVDDDRSGPKQWSVLPVGDGLTTLGET